VAALAVLPAGVILKQRSLLAGLREEQGAKLVDTRVPSKTPTPDWGAPPGQDERRLAREKRLLARLQQELLAASRERERLASSIEQPLLSYSNGRPRPAQVDDARQELSSARAVFTRPRRVSKPEAGQKHTAYHLWIYRDEDVAKPRRVVVVSVDDNKARVRQLLLKELKAKLAAYSGQVWSVNTHQVGHASEELSKVNLAISEQRAGQQSSVQLSVSVEAGGQNHDPMPLFHGSGSSIEAASTEALAQAIPKVFITIKQLLSEPTMSLQGASGGGDDLTGKELRRSNLRNTEGSPGVRGLPARYCEDS
jgi:hypothetical protein